MNRADETGRHPSEPELLAWIDRELTAEATRRLDAHLERCERCRTVLRGLEGEVELFTDALRRVEVHPPSGNAAAVRRRAALRRMWPAAAAAAMALFLAGSAAALMPGSPLRTWLGRTLSGEADGVQELSGAAPVAAVTRLAVVAPDSLDLLVDPSADSVELWIIRSQGDELMVRSPAGGSAPRFELGQDRIRMVAGEGGILHVVVPGRVRFRVLVGDEVAYGLPSPSGEVPPAPGDTISIVRVGPPDGGRAR